MMDRALITRLRVLLVEDVPEDAAAVLQHLRSEGYEPEHQRVDTDKGLREALAESEWDIVISDYRLSHFEVTDVLRVVREQAKDIPFIVVSSTVLEDAAVECMRAGAADFVLKDRLVRLGPAVARELKESASRRARRHAEYSLRRSEARARQIVAASSEGIVIIDSAGLVRYINVAAEKMLGRPAASLLGAELPLSLPRGGGSSEVELPAVSDPPVTMELRQSSLEWAGEDSTVVFLHDITLRRLAEQRLKESFVSLADTLAKAMASRDPYTTGHQQRVARLSVLVGSAMDLGEEQLWQLRLAGLLHDVGKVAVPESLLTKPGTLTVEETDIVRMHAQAGYEILKDSGLPPAVALMTLHHHERLNGSGYPDGLMASDLSLDDRILAASNVLDSRTAFRPYRKALPVQTAMASLIEGKDTLYDASVVDRLNEIVAAGQYVPGNQ